MHLNMIDLERFLYVKEDPQLNDPNFLNKAQLEETTENLTEEITTSHLK